MAVEHPSHAYPSPRLKNGLYWLVYHFFSFELLLVMFVFGVRLQALLPRPPVPETVFYGALSIAVGCWIIWRDGIYLRGIPIFLAGLVFSGWMLASYGWSPSQILARESLPFVMGVNLWALFAAACIVAGSRERMIRLLLMIMLLSTVLATIATYIELTTGSFRFYTGPDGSWHERTYLDWGNIAGTGAAIAIAIIIYTRFGGAKQLLIGACCGVCLYFLFFAGARGAFLGAMVAIMAVFLINMPRVSSGFIEMPRTLVFGLLALLIVGGLVIYMYLTGETTNTLGRILRLFESADDPLLRRGPNRFDYYFGAYQAWLVKPLFGHGLYGFSTFYCGYDQQGCHPHNVLLHALSDFGLIGFLLYLAFVWTGIRRFTLTSLQHDPLQVTLLVAFLATTIYAFVAASLPTDHRVFFFIGLLALRPPPDDEDEDDQWSSEQS